MVKAVVRAQRLARQKLVDGMDVDLYYAMKAALKAWIKADLAANNREAKLSEARLLTGQAVDKGLLK